MWLHMKLLERLSLGKKSDGHFIPIERNITHTSYLLNCQR